MKADPKEADPPVNLSIAFVLALCVAGRYAYDAEWRNAIMCFAVALIADGVFDLARLAARIADRD